MPATYSRSITVKTDAERAYAFLANKRNLPQFVSNYAGSEMVSAPPVAVGSEFRHRISFRTMVVSSVETITELVPPRRVVSQERSGSHVSTVTYEIEADGEDSVRITSTIAPERRPGFVLGTLLRANRRIRRMQTTYMTALKRVLEAQSP